MTLVQTFARIESWRAAEGCSSPVTPLVPSPEFDAVVFGLFRSTASTYHQKAGNGRSRNGGSGAPFTLPPRYPEMDSTPRPAAVPTMRGLVTPSTCGWERVGRARQDVSPATTIPSHEVKNYAGQVAEEAEEVASVGDAFSCPWKCGGKASRFLYRESGSSFTTYSCSCGWWG